MGESISDRAANGEGEPDPDELFPLGNVDGGPKTLKTLIPPGAKVRSTVSIKSAEVPAGAGIFDPNSKGRLLVEFQLGEAKAIPHREEGKVVSWTVRQVIEPTFVERVDAEGADIEAAFELLLDGDPNAAGKLLDKLKRRAGKALATA